MEFVLVYQREERRARARNGHSGADAGNSKTLTPRLKFQKLPLGFVQGIWPFEHRFKAIRMKCICLRFPLLLLENCWFLRPFLILCLSLICSRSQNGPTINGAF